jgi:hypothetical protein
MNLLVLTQLANGSVTFDAHVLNLPADFADAIPRLKSQRNTFHPTEFDRPFQYLVGGFH